MPEPDRVCGRVSFLPSARVRMTRPPGIGRPSGAVRVGPSKYSAARDLPCAQLYWTVATGEGVCARAAPAVRNTKAAIGLPSMTILLGRNAARATPLCPCSSALLDVARRVDLDIDLRADAGPRAWRVLPDGSRGKAAIAIGRDIAQVAIALVLELAAGRDLIGAGVGRRRRRRTCRQLGLVRKLGRRALCLRDACGHDHGRGEKGGSHGGPPAKVHALVERAIAARRC